MTVKEAKELFEKFIEELNKYNENYEFKVCLADSSYYDYIYHYDELVNFRIDYKNWDNNGENGVVEFTNC